MRTLRIELVEEEAGRKRVAHRVFEATAILILDPVVAGQGFLALARDMVRELDGGAPPVPTSPDKNHQTPPTEPEPDPGPEPTRDPSQPGFTTKRIVKKKATV